MPCGWLFISFAHAAKETEAKKKAGLHFVGGIYSSFAKASELASLKQPMLFYALSEEMLFRLQNEALV